MAPPDATGPVPSSQTSQTSHSTANVVLRVRVSLFHRRLAGPANQLTHWRLSGRRELIFITAIPPPLPPSATYSSIRRSSQNTGRDRFFPPPPTSRVGPRCRSSHSGLRIWTFLVWTTRKPGLPRRRALSLPRVARELTQTPQLPSRAMDRVCACLSMSNVT